MPTEKDQFPDRKMDLRQKIRRRMSRSNSVRRRKYFDRVRRNFRRETAVDKPAGQ